MGELRPRKAPRRERAGEGWCSGHPRHRQKHRGADLLALQLLKEATGSNRPLLQPDPTLPGRYSIGGAPLIGTSAKVAGTALVAAASTIVIGVGKDVQVSFSADARFTADAVVARVVARIDFTWSDIRGGVLIGT